jgi:hypothetical protein
MLVLGLRLRFWFGLDIEVGVWSGERGLDFSFSFLCLGGGRKGLMFCSALMVVVVCGVWWCWGMGWGGWLVWLVWLHLGWGILVGLGLVVVTMMMMTMMLMVQDVVYSTKLLYKRAIEVNR